jgi:hypothetical protein
VILRIGAFALGILAVTACSLSGNSSQNNNPLSGVTIIQPTVTPVTPTPTPSPTPPPNAVEALTDTGFESGGLAAGWTACSIPHVIPSSTATPFPAVASGQPIGAAIVSATSPAFQVATSPSPAATPAIYAGTYAAFTYAGTGAETTYGGGTAGTNGVCQTFTVPENAMLSMYVNEGGSDYPIKYGDQQADIIATGGTDTNLFYELNDPGDVADGGTAGGTWVQKGPYALTAAPYNFAVGQSVTLFVGSFDNSPGAKYGVYMFVDNVTVTGISSGASLHRGSAPAAHERLLPR